MTRFSKETVEHLGRLCRIALSEEQKESICHDLKKILAYMDLLSEVDTDGVKPCTTIAEAITQAPLRDDTVGEMLQRDVFLKNAPQQFAGLVRVPEVMKSGE